METATVEEVKPQAKKLTALEEVAKLREDLTNVIQSCKDELDQMKAMQTTPPTPVIIPAEDTVEMLATGQLLCPKCNLMLEGFSATGERTLRFSHPFSQSPKLGGKQCEYTGWVFSPPKIKLQVVAKPAKRG